MEAQSFGDQHTVNKLKAVENYLKAYATALKFQTFELVYVDACAGSGYSVPRSAFKDAENENQGSFEGFTPLVADTDKIIDGSAVRALSVEPPFHHYLFNDLKRSNVKSLNKIVKDKFPNLVDRVEVTHLDANEMLRNLCQNYDWKSTRAVVFLDPFGLQIEYDTLRLLAQTNAVDLWYLVPVFAMYRQVSELGEINEDGGPRVDAALGTATWRQVAVTEHQTPTSLFDQPALRSKRAVDIAWFEKVAKERIGEAFGGRVLPETLPLGRNGIQEFSLMFAWANPSEKAKELAGKLARAVLK
jgi:three-Cys-motif partner protein